jgi:hypothetical protein
MEATEALAPQPNGVAALRQQLERCIELDFTTPVAFATLCVLYIGSRVPWLDLGYGTDPDAWRVALTADYLWAEGDYIPSRLPGYPLHEFVTAGAIKGGWIWTNLSTVLVSLAGVYLFAWLARKLELPSRGALTLAFAFSPLLWINSASTMDYMWALTAILAAYLAVLYGAPTGAGIAIGAAAGFRLTSLFALLPFWLLLWRTGRRDEIRPVTLTAAAVTLGLYTPVLMDYGLNFLNFYDQDVPLEDFVRHLAKDGLGIIGSLALLIGLALSLPRLRAFPRDLARDPHVLAWTLVIAVFFVTYLRLPHEIAYLIPIFPFGFFLLGRYMHRAVLLGTLAVIVLSGAIDVTSPDDDAGLDRSTFTSARIGQGMLLSDMDTLENQREFAREVREFTLQHPEVAKPAVVMVGFIYPELVMLYRDELTIGTLERDLEAISQLSDKGLATDELHDIKYVWLLDYKTFHQFLEQQAHIYFTADAARSTFAVYGYRPGYFGAQRLPLSRENPSLGEGAASTDR